MKRKITVKIAIFVSPKQRAFSFKQRDKIGHSNLHLARTPVPHDESMPPPMPPQDELDAIDYSANKNNSDKFISANSTDSEYNTTDNLILFLLKHLNDLI